LSALLSAQGGFSFEFDMPIQECTEAPEGVQRKQFGFVTKMAPAQPSDLDLIKQHTQPGAEIAAEDVLIVQAKLAHDQYDRSHERFPVSYLQRFAETLPGKALLEGHDYNKRPQGRWFDAEVRADGDGHALFAKFYVKSTSELADEIRLGIAKDVSIGFIPDKRLCDVCEKDFDRDCQHFAGQEYDGKLATVTYGGDEKKAEAVEGSIVWLGCQPGAQVLGQSSPLYQRKMALAAAAQSEGVSMTELEEARAEIDRLKAELAAGAGYKTAAEKYEASLREEILRLTKAKELATTRDTKAAEQAVEFTTLMLRGASVEHLETMKSTLQEQTKTLLAPNGKAEGAEHVPSGDGSVRQKRQAWEPRVREF
jgi:hypothetical protein